MLDKLASEQPPFSIKFDKDKLEKWFARFIYLAALAAITYGVSTWTASKLQIRANTSKIENHEVRIGGTEKRLDDKDKRDDETVKVLYQMKGTLETIEKRTR